MEKIEVQIQQSLQSLFFVLAVAASVSILFFSQTETLLAAWRAGELLPFGFHENLIRQASSSDIFCTSLTVLTALPVSGSYIEELRSGFIKEYLPRVGYREYLAGKSFSCLITGGLVPVAAVWLTYAISALVFMPVERAAAVGEIAERFTPELCEISLSLFLFGGLWALVGLAAASFWNSRYMAYSFPFILYYLLIILTDRYLPKVYVLNPAEWLGMAENWPFGKVGLMTWLIECIGVAAMGFVVTAERRLRRL